MDNEATKILDPQQNPTSQDRKIGEDALKKGTGFGARVAATATGAALGTSAAIAAEHIYQATAENGDDNVAQEPLQSEEPDTVQAENESQAPNTGVEQEVHGEVSQQSEPDAVPEDATYVDDDMPGLPPASDVVEDGDIHVIGVAVQDNGQGGIATLAGLQSGDDTALVVDVESDGRLDYIIHDDNGNGSFEAEEWHDIGNQGQSTASVIGSYVEESQAHDATPVVTDLDSGDNYVITETEQGYGLSAMDETPADDNNIYSVSADDMPDYMNDVDAGIMDA